MQESSISTLPGMGSVRVAIVGSRNFVDLEAVREYVRSLPQGTVVVSGGAQGVDDVATESARACGLSVEVFLPDWKQHGVRRAPLERNKKIAANGDRMVAFWDGKSTGTMHAVSCARKLGKPVEILGPR